MTKSLTGITLELATIDAGILNAAEFCEKYEDLLEYLDVDNIMDYNDGTVNVKLYADNGTETFLFVDGYWENL